MREAAGSIQALLEARQRERERRFVITTNDVLAPLLFSALGRTVSELRIEVVVSDDELALAPGQVDLAVRPSQDPSGMLRGRRLGRLRLGVYRAPNGSKGWILPSASLRAKASMRWWRHVPDDAKGTVECNSLLGMRDACVAGLGRAVLPALLAHEDERLVLEHEVDGGTPVWLLSPASRNADRSLRAMRDSIGEALRGVSRAWCS
jgi:DNA-binding transcriptional LysR family regulator